MTLDPNLTELVTSIAVRTARSLTLERSWTRKLTKGDPLWARLPNVRRDHAYIGRMFVAWRIEDGKPLIDSLYKVEGFSLGQSGISVTIATVSAAGPTQSLHIRHTPQKAPLIDVYFWIPNFAEVRYTPANNNDPDSHFSCSTPLMIKFQHPHNLSQVDNRLYFAPKSEFVTLWPAFDF